MAKVSEIINGAVARWGGLVVLAVLELCQVAGLYCAGWMVGRPGFACRVAGVMGFISFLVGAFLVGLAMANEIKAIRNELK